ncbi:phosphodiesterase [Cryobacterium tepidiphilum]|uniref:Phosphodiesterase n=1 Tax=Cryobacterium tepidiphilum TaxID=2486026 RepID=A0A3M8LHY8_9MICO|nr:phosphodiesterase [Cryobacterium tepidiphilum]RNE64108.1 phosphodiesterase [Cryobacterium tepidiphilum]
MDNRTAEYPRPDHFLLHVSDTHLRAGNGRLYETVDGAAHLERLFDDLVASGQRPELIVFTGDLADRGEPGAYERLRTIVEPAAERVGAGVLWVMGNHDDRGAFRAGLLGETPRPGPIDRVVSVNGLRVIALDTTVPGHHHGEVSPAQLEWLAAELSQPAPDGTILAMHHPPVPSVLDLAASVELRDQAALASVLRGTDVRSVLAGHLHYSSTAMFAGIPVSVASATCYTQDLTVPVGGTRGQDGARSFNLVHLYPDTVLHSVVPFGDIPVLDYVDAAESSRLLAASGTEIAPAGSLPAYRQPPRPVPAHR